MECCVESLPIQEDRIHVGNGTLYLDGSFSEEKTFCRNRLPVRYNPNAGKPGQWKAFLSQLLQEEDVLTLQEFFEKLRDEPQRWGKPFEALLGALTAQLGLDAAAIGGKDSMSGSFLDKDVPPTLISFAIAPVKAGEVLSNEW